MPDEAQRHAAETTKPRLLDRVRAAIRMRHYSRHTESAYVAWIRRYIVFHGRRHPSDLGAADMTRFLSALAVDGKVAASTQNQALSALLFLYREVLGLDLPWLDGIVWARRPQRLPIVLTRDEVRAVLRQLNGPPRLMAYLMYGAGLRLLECCRLRIQDVDFGGNEIVVRGGKGDKDRVTMLPAIVKNDLRRHIEATRLQHRRDIEHGGGWVELPSALARKYFDYLTQGEIAHQARRRYNSSNLRTTCAAAFWKSSSCAARMSATAARASSSGDSPSLSASWRSRSAWAADSSMLSFMAALYRGGAPSNKPLERPGMDASRPAEPSSAGRSAPRR